ncbi:hypothetical protein E4T56_gene17499, partial [Termitomyces sp. T112]
VQVLLDRGIGGRAERIEHGQHLVALDQLADLFDGLRRRVAVVIADEVDLATVDAALVVDHLEIGFFGLADDAIGRRRTAVRHDVADLDLGVGCAGVVFLLGKGRAGGEGRDRRRERGVLSELSGELLAQDRDLPCAMRHEVDDEEQEDAEHGAGEALGDALRHVRHEDDEGGADERAGQPAHAADDHAEEQRDRERDGVAVGRDELHRDGAERAGDAGDRGRHAEGQGLVSGDVDAHR